MCTSPIEGLRFILSIHTWATLPKTPDCDNTASWAVVFPILNCLKDAIRPRRSHTGQPRLTVAQGRFTQKGGQCAGGSRIRGP